MVAGSVAKTKPHLLICINAAERVIINRVTTHPIQQHAAVARIGKKRQLIYSSLQTRQLFLNAIVQGIIRTTPYGMQMLFQQ